MKPQFEAYSRTRVPAVDPPTISTRQKRFDTVMLLLLVCFTSTTQTACRKSSDADAQAWSSSKWQEERLQMRVVENGNQFDPINITNRLHKSAYWDADVRDSIVKIIGEYRTHIETASSNCVHLVEAQDNINHWITNLVECDRGFDVISWRSTFASLTNYATEPAAAVLRSHINEGETIYAPVTKDLPVFQAYISTYLNNMSANETCGRIKTLLEARCLSLAGVRRIRLQVERKGDIVEDKTFNPENIVSRFLSGAGFVVSTNGAEADLEVILRVNGQALWNSYESVYQGVSGARRYTGARLEGEIVCMKGQSFTTNVSFLGSKRPLEQFKETPGYPQYATPAAAPFREVFCESFVSPFIDLSIGLFGEDGAVSALRSCSPNVLSHYSEWDTSDPFYCFYTSAIKSLSAKGSSITGALIRALPTVPNEHDLVSRDLVRLLERITKQKLGNNPKAWREWWARVQAANILR